MIDRLLLAAALASVLTMLVAACGGGDPGADFAPESHPGEPTRDAALRADAPSSLPARSSTPPAAPATIAATATTME